MNLLHLEGDLAHTRKVLPKRENLPEWCICILLWRRRRRRRRGRRRRRWRRTRYRRSGQLRSIAKHFVDTILSLPEGELAFRGQVGRPIIVLDMIKDLLLLFLHVRVSILHHEQIFLSQLKSFHNVEGEGVLFLLGHAGWSGGCNVHSLELLRLLFSKSIQLSPRTGIVSVVDYMKDTDNLTGCQNQSFLKRKGKGRFEKTSKRKTSYYNIPLEGSGG